MGKRVHTETEFGSDSFLDVIANIVGILIILVVTAGFRVSQAPLPTAAEIAEAAAGARDPEPAEPVIAATAPAEEEIPEIEVGPPAELVVRAQEIETEIAKLEKDAANREREVKKLAALQKLERQEVSLSEQELAKQTVEKNRLEERLKRLAETIDERKAVLAKLLEQIESMKKVAPHVKKIGHRVTPIAQVVKGDEIHFRLAAGKVSVVPLKDLIESLLRQAERQKEWLAQYRAHEGTVGPIGGYTMNYLIERKSMSVMDQINQGPGVFRVEVTAFKVIPASNLRAETEEEALQMGSEFHIALQTAKPGSTFTCWVYPDSYGLYRKLQEVAHDSGLSVAARPLPFGVPIAGSPSGTRSAGQ